MNVERITCDQYVNLGFFHTIYYFAKFIHLIEWSFQREGSPYLAYHERNVFVTSDGRVKICVKQKHIF